MSYFTLIFKGKKTAVLLLFVAIIWLFCLNSCMTGAVLQTAKPVAKGESYAAINVAGVLNEFYKLPDVNFNARFHISQRSDLGITVSSLIFGTHRLDYKYLLLRSKSENFHLSSGLVFDGCFVDESSDYAFIFSLPLYISLNDSKNCTFYLGQRFGVSPIGLRYHFLKNGRNVPQKNARYQNYTTLTGGVGVRFGKPNNKFLIEVSYSIYQDSFYRTKFENDNWDYFTNSYKLYGIQVNFCKTLRKRPKKLKAETKFTL